MPVKPKPFRLSPKAVKNIHKAVDNLFDKVKARLIGSWSVDKRIKVEVNPRHTLPALYAEAATQHSDKEPDKQTLEGLLEVTEAYLDAKKAATKATITHDLTGFLTEAHTKGIKTDLETAMYGKLDDIFGKVTSDLKRLVDTEAQSIKNTGSLVGLMQVNADAGIEDPVVAFLTARDNLVCQECRRLHLMEDGITPRLWYLSELSHSYHKKGGATPSLAGLHPNCRCCLVTIMPGYGFDSSGKIVFKSIGYKAIEEQRGLDKSELTKSLFEQAAFRHKVTGDVIPTGPTHETSKLPDLIGFYEDGFVNKAGDFFTRNEAAKVAKAPMGESDVLRGIGALPKLG